MKKTTLLILILVSFALPLLAQQDSLKIWRRNTYPGPLHKASPDFPPYQGSDRGEWLNFFKVSPADPTFMLTGFDMGTPAYSTDGRSFHPLEVPHHRFSSNADFSPHDGNTAYILWTPSGSASGEDNIYGIWRTRDKGKSWDQIYRIPSGGYEINRPIGQNLIVTDPHVERRQHIYFGSFQRGLMRSLDEGKNWEVAAFPGQTIKTMSAARGPDDLTVMYVIVTPEAAKPGVTSVPSGELWRLEVLPDPPYEIRSFRLKSPDADFVEVDVNPDDWEKGVLLRKPPLSSGYRGSRATELVFFKCAGTYFYNSRTVSEADVSYFGEVRINPRNSQHIVLKCHVAKTNRSLQYSLDGGETWNPPQPVINGYIPDILCYNPGNYASPAGAKPETDIYSNQIQGPSIGFDSSDPKVVYCWTTDFMKTPLKSQDYGQTWKPFAYGGIFKRATQISAGPDGKHIATGRGEYGFVTTRDGGLSWTGNTVVNSEVLNGILERFLALSDAEQDSLRKNVSWRNTGNAVAKYGYGIGIDPHEPRVLVSIYGVFPVLLKSNDGGLTWEEKGKAGGQGSVYWHNQKPMVVYAADMKSEDKGETWRSIGRVIHAVSAGNGDILTGMEKVGDNRLSFSTDGGDHWTDLPELPKERVTGTSFVQNAVPLTSPNYVLPAHAVAIDPGSDATNVRILAAGRSGVYEYQSEWLEKGESSWKVLNEGFHPSIHFSRVEPVPWIGRVAFDPRPGFENVVYAVKSADPVLTGKWRGDDNPNMKNPNGQAKRPLYRSLDGGLTWESLHSPQYEGIPEYLDVTAITVGLDGTFYVDGFHGLYLLKGIDTIP